MEKYVTSSTDKSILPVTTLNTAEYVAKMVSSSKDVEEGLTAETRKDKAKQKEALYSMFISPMVEMGYDYDFSIKNLAVALIENQVSLINQPLIINATMIISVAKEESKLFLEHGFISSDTAELLEASSL